MVNLFRQGLYYKIPLLVLYYAVLRYFPVSYFPLLGSVSKQLRFIVCRKIFKNCGKNVNIERGAFFGSGLNLEIGDNSGLGINCSVPSDLVIGNDVLMGANLYIFSHNHNFSDKTKLIRNQGFQDRKQTIIEDDVWIGMNCVFTPGRRISKGTVIGTNSVVTKDFAEYSVIGGNPARLLKIRE